MATAISGDENRTRTFLVLWIACIVGAACVIPYVATNRQLTRMLPPFTLGSLIIVVLAQSTLLFAGFVLLGLVLAHRVSLGTPFVSARVAGVAPPGFGRVALRSLLIGLAAGAVIFVMDRWVFGIFIEPITRAQDQAVWWSRLLACVYGGIDEEVAMRFALMTFLVWVCWKMRRTPDNKPTAGGVWASIIAASVVMGLMHLPLSGYLVVITPLAVVRAVVLNSFVAIPCGWSYWKEDLESAMAIHFGGDLALHGLLPLITR
jgi:membrane protease YdiL (CAAX protease family)